MPTWAKIILTVMAILIALFIGAGFVGYHWMMKNKDHFIAIRKEGITFGGGKDFAQCADAALSRLGGGMASQIEARLFLEGCLSRATKSETVCEGAPPKSEIMRTAQWAVENCRRRGKVNEQGCTQVFQTLSEACQR